MLIPGSLRRRGTSHPPVPAPVRYRREQLLHVPGGFRVGNDRGELGGQGDEKGFLAFVELAPFPLLNDQHAEHLPVMNHRYPEESVEGFLADLRDEMKARMHGGVVQIDGFSPFRHQSHQPLFDCETDLPTASALRPSLAANSR